MKRTALALVIVSTLLISLVLRVQYVGVVEANPTVGGYWENSNTVAVPLKITILSPENTTYQSSDLNLTIKITKTETQEPMEVRQFYITYTLEINPFNPPILVEQDVVNNDCTPEIYYSTVLHNLADGQRHILVSAECFPENVTAYWWRTKTYAEVYFSIDAGSSIPTPAPTPTPTPSPKPIQAEDYPEGPRLLWNRTISEWNETAGQYRHSFASKIIQSSDGGYVIVGGSNGSSSKDWYDWWLVKTDSNANVEWEKTFGGPYQDFAHSVIQTSDGGFAIAGTMNDRATVVKTDSEGNTQWKRTYSDSIRASIIQTNDGGYAIACGDRGPPKSFHESLFGEPGHFQIVKTDDSGYEEWSKTYGEGTAYSIIQTSNGGYILGGSNSVVKTDSLGGLEWQKTYGSSDDYALSVVQTSDDAFVLFGMLTVDRRCPGLIKINAEGNILWEKNYLRDRAIPSLSGLVGTRDGGYIFCATEDWTIEEGDVFGEVVKVDPEGNISWVISTINGAAESVFQTFDGGYALVETGTLMDYEAWKEYYSAVWIIKTDKDSANPAATDSPTSTPSVAPNLYDETQLEQEVILGVAIMIAVIGAGLSLLIYLIKRK